MYCSRCGTQNEDAAAKCVRCGELLQGGSAAAPPVHVPSHLVWAILCTICCCWPFGVVAIVYAAISMSRAGAGDYAAASAASRNARTWCWVSFGTGLAWMLFWLVAFVLPVLVAAAAAH